MNSVAAPRSTIASFLNQFREGAKFIMLVALMTFALFYVGCIDLHEVEFPLIAKADGVVKRLDYENRQITIDHGKVGEIIDPLTMAYPVKDVQLMDSIRDEDSIVFTLVESGPGDFLVTSIDRKN